MEIEIKAICHDLGKVKEIILSLGAIEDKRKHQIDEYYNHPNKDLRKTNEYIRLRYISGGINCTFAYHINIDDGVNKEFEVNVDDLKVFKQILDNLGFKLLGVIDKKRETYKLDDFKITLDEVKNIGNFIEIEVEGDESEIAQKKNSCISMAEKLHIDKKDICHNIWLCDIATGKIKWKNE